MINIKIKYIDKIFPGIDFSTNRDFSTYSIKRLKSTVENIVTVPVVPTVTMLDQVLTLEEVDPINILPLLEGCPRSGSAWLESR